MKITNTSDFNFKASSEFHTFHNQSKGGILPFLLRLLQKDGKAQSPGALTFKCSAGLYFSVLLSSLKQIASICSLYSSQWLKILSVHSTYERFHSSIK